ncbi:MAG: hypothetical protein EON59_00605 [Alphaproteobacteria bacterium]|nr:MAG: hypothetical protein EON59_00605 [Alphaproteobacteria bacterium]
MATSGETAFSLTARDFVRHALLDAKVLPAGTEPDATELEDCITRLNMMLKTWASKGAGLWRSTNDTATITGGVASVLLSPGIREVSDARVVVSAAYHRQLGKWGRADYQSLPNKTAVGTPSVFYVDRQRDAARLYVWPVPATDTTLSIDCDRQIETITDASETIDVPEEYSEAVMLNLALRCAPLFGPDLGQVQSMRAMELEQQLLDDGRPDSYFMAADAY